MLYHILLYNDIMKYVVILKIVQHNVKLVVCLAHPFVDEDAPVVFELDVTHHVSLKNLLQHRGADQLVLKRLHCNRQSVVSRPYGQSVSQQWQSASACQHQRVSGQGHSVGSSAISEQRPTPPSTVKPGATGKCQLVKIWPIMEPTACYNASFCLLVRVLGRVDASSRARRRVQCIGLGHVYNRYTLFTAGATISSIPAALCDHDDSLQ